MLHQDGYGRAQLQTELRAYSAVSYTAKSLKTHSQYYIEDVPKEQKAVDKAEAWRELPFSKTSSLAAR